MKLKFYIGFGLVLLAGVARADTTLDQSFDTGMAGGFIHYFGGDYGQTFTAASDPVLDDFTLYENSFNGQVGFTFTVARWDGSSPGPALFTSAPVESPAISAPGGTDFEFSTDGLVLTPGQQYIGYLNAVSSTNVFAMLGSELSYQGHLVPPLGTDYGGGEAVTEESPGVWSADPDTDTRFIAHFSPAVPEPPALALFAGPGLGVLALCAYGRRRTAK